MKKWRENATLDGQGVGAMMMWGMMVIWGGLIALILWLICSLFPSTNRPSPTDAELGPLEILARRYARGEISREEYDVMHQEIERTMRQEE